MSNPIDLSRRTLLAFGATGFAGLALDLFGGDAANAAGRVRPCKVAIARLSGPYCHKLRAALAARIATTCHVIPMPLTDRLVARAAARRHDAARWLTFAQMSGNAALITGQITNGLIWRLHLDVHQGGTGAKLGELSWESLEPIALMSDALDEAPTKLVGMLTRARRERVAGPRVTAPTRGNVGTALG